MCMLAYVQMNLFGIAILLFFWLNQRRSGSLALEDRLFNGILITAMAEQLMDAGQWALDGAVFPGSYVLLMLCYMLGYAIAPVITCLWAMYCDLRTNMDERGLRRRAPAYFLPSLLYFVLLIANLFTPLVFRIDANHVYHRDHLFFLYMALMYLYGFVSLLMVIRKALQRDSSVERTEFRYMALFIIPPLLGGLLQWLFYGLSLIWMCVVLSIVLVYTNVLSRQITTDPLTGLNNRRKLNRYLDTKINSGQADQSTFLMMLDADDFKGINDHYGHSAGDRALVNAAEILKSLCLGRDFFLARLGGDEFVILGRDQDGIGPDTLAERIEAQTARFNAAHTEPFRLSLSIGWAHFHPQKVSTADALLTAADQHMYIMKAKRHGV